MLSTSVPAVAIVAMIGAVAYLGLQHLWLARNTPRSNLHRGISWLTLTVLLLLVGRLVQLGHYSVAAAQLGVRVQWVGMLGMASAFVLAAARRRGVRWWPALLFAPIAAAALLFSTHAFVTDARLPRIGFFGNRYFAVGSGPLAYVAQLAGVLWAVAWVRAAMKAHAWNRWTTTMLLIVPVLLSGVIVHDVAMNAGLLHSVHAIDYGVVALTFALSHLTTRRWSQHLVSLETAVETRTSELAGAVRELGESEERYRQLADTTLEGIAVLRDGHIVDANAALERMCGRSRTELIGRGFQELFDESQRAAVTAAVTSPLAASLEVVARCKDGNNLPVELVIQRHDDRVVVAIRDLSERRELQKKLQIADRMASLGTLAAGVAHEINNPLAYLLSNVQVASERAREVHDPDSELLECLADAEKGCLRVKKIVEDMRKLTREPDHDAGARDLHPILDDCLQMADNEIRHRARIERAYEPVPNVSAGDGRLAQVFLNVIINAAQAMPVGEVDRMRLRVATRTDAAGRAVVEIGDTGAGIPKNITARVFEPFFTTKGPGGGTGLGLAICHSIVTSLGGNIEVESTLGRGTVVRVILPAAEVVGPTAQSRRSQHPAPQRLAVLVVDDEPAVRRAVARVLGNCDITAASGGNEAYALCETRGFDVILCDLMMPESSGMELYARLSRNFPELAPRVVFVTGGAFTKEASDFLNSVNNTVLKKPFDITELRRAVQSTAAPEEEPRSRRTTRMRA